MFIDLVIFYSITLRPVMKFFVELKGPELSMGFLKSLSTNEK